MDALPPCLLSNDLYSYVFDLTYAGHADFAQRVTDLAWPAGVRGKDEFQRQVRERLTASPYWPAVTTLNSW